MNKKSILGGLAVVLFVMPTIAGFKIAELQSLIDSASAQGGGVVVIPPGKWEMGPVSLKSNVTLHLEKGAILLGLTDAGVYRRLVCRRLSIRKKPKTSLLREKE